MPINIIFYVMVFTHIIFLPWISKYAWIVMILWTEYDKQIEFQDHESKNVYEHMTPFSGMAWIGMKET